MERVSIALVGCGIVSYHHLKAIQTHNDLIYVSALVDTNSANIQKLQLLVDSFKPPLSPSNPPVRIFSSFDEAIQANEKSFVDTGF